MKINGNDPTFRLDMGDPVSNIPIRLEIASRILAQAPPHWFESYYDGSENRRDAAIKCLRRADALIAAHNETQAEAGE